MELLDSNPITAPQFSHDELEMIPVNEFDYNENLARDKDIIVLVKWLNQLYHDDNLRSLANGSWDPIKGVSIANSQTHKNQYYPGLLAYISLDNEELTAERSYYTENFPQPTGIDIGIGKIAIAAANMIIVRDALDNKTGQQVLTNDWFARLHAVEFTNSNSLLTVSSALDLLIDTDLESGDTLWGMSLWDHGYNVNKVGHIFTRQAPQEKHYVNPDPERLVKPNHRGLTTVINDPSIYKGLGLPTYAVPAYPNGLHQINSGQNILLTSFRFGELWSVNRETHEIKNILGGMEHPHGFTETDSGYVISDTGHDDIIFLNRELRPVQKLSLAGFADKKPGLSQVSWLQNTVNIGDGLFAAISSMRQKISIIDPAKQEFRDICIDPDWGIQTLVPTNGSTPL